MEFYRYHAGATGEEMTIPASDRSGNIFYGYHVLQMPTDNKTKKPKDASGTFNTVRLKKYLGLGSKRKRIGKGHNDIAPNVYAVEDAQLKRLVCGPSAVPNVYYAAPGPPFASPRPPPTYQAPEQPPCWLYGSVAFRGPSGAAVPNMVPAYASVSARSVKTRASRPAVYAWEPFTYAEPMNSPPVDSSRLLEAHSCEDTTCKGWKQRGKCTCGHRSRRNVSKYAPRTSILEYASCDGCNGPSSPDGHLTHNFIARYPPVEQVCTKRCPGTMRSRSMSPGRQRDHRMYSKVAPVQEYYSTDMTDKNQCSRKSILECNVNPYELIYKEGRRQMTNNRRMTTMDLPLRKTSYEDCNDSLGDNILERDTDHRKPMSSEKLRTLDPPKQEFRLSGQKIRLFGTVKCSGDKMAPVTRRAPPPPPPTVRAPPIPTRPPPERTPSSKGTFVSYVSLENGKDERLESSDRVARVRSPVTTTVLEALEQQEAYSPSRPTMVKTAPGIHKTTVGIGARAKHPADTEPRDNFSCQDSKPVQTLDLKKRLNLRINLRDVAAAVAALKPILKKNPINSSTESSAEESEPVVEENFQEIEESFGRFSRKKHVHFTSSCDSASSENLVNDGCSEEADDSVFGSQKDLSTNSTEELDRAVSESEDEVYDDCQVGESAENTSTQPIYENHLSITESSLPKSVDESSESTHLKVAGLPIHKRTTLRRSLSERQINGGEKFPSSSEITGRPAPVRSNSFLVIPDVNSSVDEKLEEEIGDKCKTAPWALTAAEQQMQPANSSWAAINNRSLSSARNNTRTAAVRPQVPPPPVPTKRNDAPVEIISLRSVASDFSTGTPSTLEEISSDWTVQGLRLPRPVIYNKGNGSPLRSTREPVVTEATPFNVLYNDATSVVNELSEMNTPDFKYNIPESRSPTSFVGESKESDFSQDNFEDDVIYEQIPEPLYEEVRDVSQYTLTSDSTGSPMYSRKSIFDGASRTEILNYLQDARERVVESLDPSEDADVILDNQDLDETLGVKRNRRNRVTHMSNVSDSSNSSEDSVRQAIVKLAKHHYGSSEVERNDSGVGSETSKPARLRRSSQSSNIEHLCCDCDQTLDPTKDFDNGEHIDPLLCRKCARRRAERKEIITEIVETEIKYGRDLKIIKEEFNRPMAVAGLLTADQLSNIFLNLEELMDVNEKFAEKLQDALDIAGELGDEDYSTVNIGRLFLESSAMLHTFETYCVRQGSAALLLANLEKERELLRIFLKVSQMENTLLRRLSLNSFLMVPVQRVTKYPLLVNRLHKVTPYHNQDREMLREAQMKIELHLEHINQQAKDISGMNLWRRISNISSAQRRSLLEPVIGNIKLRKKALEVLGWNSEEVRFVLEGRLLYTQLTENMWNRKEKPLKFIPVHALLVTLGQPNSNYRPDLADREPLFPRDMGIREVSLLLIKEKNNRFSLLRDPFHLHHCVVSADSELEDVFEVKEFTTKDVLFLKADDSKDSQEWLKQLRYHAKDLGHWRKRRNALANIMISGMCRS